MSSSRVLTGASVVSLLAFVGVSLGAPRPALGQVNDAERASARELFKSGDQLQRAGHFAEALDKFQRAEQVFAAPTNVLRIAECNAALGRLVESAEAYREVLRTPLPAGSPPAFQAAVDQARAELSQVEPRVPRLVIEVQPQGVPNPQLQIDGQGVPGALIGEPVPLDPGNHKLAIVAPGYASTEQEVDLKERDTKTAVMALNAISGVTYAPGPGTPPASPVPPPPLAASADGTPPPPPALQAPDFEGPAARHTNAGLILGAHLGLEGATGLVPTPESSSFVSPSSVGAGGVAFGLDGGFRFGRHWYLGLTMTRANFTGANLSDLDSGVTAASSNTTLLALVGAFIANPDRVSFYAEIGAGDRWYDVRETLGTTQRRQLYDTGEGALGLGVWIPAGRSFRFLPKLTFGFDSFGQSPDGTSNDGTSKLATFTTLSLDGLYNLDF